MLKIKKIPKNFRYMIKFSLVFFLVSFILTSINLLYSPPIPTSHQFNRGKNAAWVRHAWFSDDHSDEQIDEFINKLKSMEMTTIYVHVGPLDSKGNIPDYDPDTWDSNRNRMKERYPELEIHAWIGGVTVKKFGIAPDTVDMDSTVLMEEIAELSKKMITKCRFDGIHYDIEPLPDDDKGFLQLLEMTRERIGKDIRISVASPHITFSDKISGFIKFLGKDTIALWGPGYYREVAKRCDEIAVMSYDSVRYTPASYRRFMAGQVRNITRAVRNTDCEILMGIPTYEETTFSHKPEVENITHGLEGTILGLSSIPDSERVRGVAIYALWTTDEKEVEIFRKLWMNVKR
jgi:hypothetical protein